MWILLKQETVSGSGISRAICKSAPRSRQPRQHPTTQFLQAGCPSCHPTNSVKALKARRLIIYTHPFNGPFPGLPGWAGTRKVNQSGLYWSKHLTTQFFTGRMPFLPPNQQRQGTKGIWLYSKAKLAQVKSDALLRPASNVTALNESEDTDPNNITRKQRDCGQADHVTIDANPWPF